MGATRKPRRQDGDSAPARPASAIGPGAEVERLRAELAEVAQQLAETQALAHVGHWSYRADRRQVTFSPEMLRIFDLPIDEPHPTFAAYRWT